MAKNLETSDVLESILLQPNIPDEFLSSLPLRKLILIRSLATSPFSPSSLLSVELLHQLRLDSSLPASPLIQSAYCAVAVGSTVAFLESGDLTGFLLTTEVTWKERLFDADANREGRGLTSPELWRWGVTLKRAMRSQDVRDELIRCWYAEKAAKVKAVEDFLKAEMEEMGPAILEIAAAAAAWLGKEEEEEEEVVIENKETFDSTLSQGDLDFNEVMDNQETSVEDIHNVVEDPLPNATIEADKLIDKPLEVMLLEEPKENHYLDLEENLYWWDVSAQLHSVDKEVIVTERTDSIELNKDAEKVMFLSDDSASDEESSDDSSPPSKKIHLAILRRSSRSKPALNLKKISRPRIRWSQLEEDALTKLVKKHGKGNWAAILRASRGCFGDRTQIDLKDKWRNMNG